MVCIRYQIQCTLLTHVVDEFVTMLTNFPPEASLISDSIYSNSQFLNGRDFAVEYLRRRNQAQKGIIEPAGAGASDKSGGWNEVAKKGPQRVEEPASGFKVVPNKKKGKK
jgi:PERQ amino acid-rich with GYF domain-containing protein